MTGDTVAVVLAIALVVVIWRYTEGQSSDGTSSPPPDNINTSATGAASDPTATGLNNQSGTYSTGVQ